LCFASPPPRALKLHPPLPTHTPVFEVTETSGAQVTDERKIDTIKRVRRGEETTRAPGMRARAKLSSARE
jgi:hypothetical protein